MERIIWYNISIILLSAYSATFAWTILQYLKFGTAWSRFVTLGIVRSQITANSTDLHLDAPWLIKIVDFNLKGSFGVCFLYRRNMYLDEHEATRDGIDSRFVAMKVWKGLLYIFSAYCRFNIIDLRLPSTIDHKASVFMRGT